MLSERVVSGGVRVRRCCAAECVGWPIQFELLEPRIMWSVASGTLALAEAGVAYGSFDNNGTVRVDGLLVEGTRSIVLQADGKMIVAGWSAPKTAPGQSYKDQATSITLVRLNRGGTIDRTYGSDGFVRFDVPSRHWYYDALPIALHADGKLLVGGEGLRRFNTNGSPDVTFGNGGVVETEESSGLVRAIALTANGQILTAGYNFNVQRFNANGSLDTTFVPADEAWGHSYPRGHLQKVLVQSDGKILMAGQEVTGGGIDTPLVTRHMLVRLNADGTVDTSFGNGGIAYQAARVGTQMDASAATPQPDGKILVAGYGGEGIVVARYNSDGALDTTFGDGGMFSSADGGSPNDIAVDSDGKIVIAGSYGGPAAWRLNSDGTLDNSFGRFHHPLHADINFAGDSYGLAIEPDGDVLLTAQAGIVGGWVNVNTAETLADLYVTRISGGRSDPEPAPDPDPNPAPPPLPPPVQPPEIIDPVPDPTRPLGELDDSFGGDGTVVTDPTGGVDRAQTVLVQADGKTIVVGYSGTYTGPGAEELGDQNTETQITLVRYNVDGTLDRSFGDDGVVTVPARNLVGMRYDGADLPAALQADGKIIVGGMALYRFNADGSIDTSFGDNGAAATGMLLVDALAILPNGKIVISTRYAFEFACYNSDGSLDTSFGGASRSTHPEPPYPVTPGNVNHNPRDVIGSWLEIGELIAQPDGKIIAVGTIRTPPFEVLVTKYYVMRMNADGALDQSFGDGGVVITSVPGWPMAEAWSVALQADGKIVVAGAGQRGTIARYNVDGSIDTSFGNDGFVVSPRAGAGADVALQANGKIVLATADGAVRYNADGTFDRAFVAPGSPGGMSVAIGPDGEIVIAAQAPVVPNGGDADFFVARFVGEGVTAPAPSPLPDGTGPDGSQDHARLFSSFSNDSSPFLLRQADEEDDDEDEEEDEEGDDELLP